MKGVLVDSTTALQNAQQLYRRLQGRRDEIEELDDYYQGKHPLKFASPEFSNFHSNQYQQFSDNWVAVIADALTERLKVEGVLLPDSGGDKAASTKLWSWWQQNAFESLSSQGFLEAIIAKRSFILVWTDEYGEPYATWEHPSQMYLRTAAEDSRIKRDGIKSWVDGDQQKEFLFYYTANEVWKFWRGYYGVTGGRTESGFDVSGTSVENGFALDGWEPYTNADDTWPLSHGLGKVPIVEIQNRPLLKTGPISDVAGAKDMQDATNLFWAYLFGAADHASMPARVVMGQAPPKIPLLDERGQKIGEQDVPLSKLQQNRIMWLTGEKAKIGEWSRADLEAFTNVIDVAVAHLGAQSRTPAHYFVANKGLSNINGETLIATETPLVKKAEDFMLYSQQPLREMWELFALAAGDVRLAVEARKGKTLFANAGIRSDSQRADAFAKDRKSGYPFEWLLQKYGESPEDIAIIMEMKRNETFDPQFQELVDSVNQNVGF